MEYESLPLDVPFIVSMSLTLEKNVQKVLMKRKVV
jgi:hypothetical protein